MTWSYFGRTIGTSLPEQEIKGQSTFDSELKNAGDNFYTQLCVHLKYKKLDNAQELLNAEAKFFVALLLISAIRCQNFELVKFIVETRSDLDLSPPLIRSMMSRALDIFNYLIDKKADVNQRARDGLTPLHIAANLAQHDMILSEKFITKLLSAGADPSMTHMGQTPLDKSYFLIKGSFPENEKEELRRIEILEKLLAPSASSTEEKNTSAKDETDIYKPYRPQEIHFRNRGSSCLVM